MNDEIKLCDYGCGQEARFQFKNGKYCCSEFLVSCPIIRKKNSESSSGIKKKPWSEEQKKQASDFWKGKRTGKKSKETKLRMSKAQRGKKKKPWSEEDKKKLGESRRGKDNPCYKGVGIYAHIDYILKLEKYEEVRLDPENPSIINVKCKQCHEWFRPTALQVRNRLGGIYGRSTGENNFYCSGECKDLCPLFNFHPHYKDYRLVNEKIKQEVNSTLPYLKKLIHERDIICQICDSDKSLQVHHIDPQKTNRLFINDQDSCILLCKKCHKKIHIEIEGCKYQELRAANCG